MIRLAHWKHAVTKPVSVVVECRYWQLADQAASADRTADLGIRRLEMVAGDGQERGSLQATGRPR